MPNNLGQPLPDEIARQMCVELLCNALLCDGCPIFSIKRAEHALHSDALLLESVPSENQPGKAPVS